MKFLRRLILCAYRWAYKLAYPRLSAQLKAAYYAESQLFSNFRDTLDYGQNLPSDLNILHKNWDTFAENNFDPKQPEKFYLSWKKETGLLNIGANIVDQFSRIELYANFEKYLDPKKSFLDIGCGTAALYWHKSKDITSATLVDVPNLAKEYVKFKIDYISNAQIKLSSPEQLNEFEKHSHDQIMCIDVIEHLKNASELFITEIDRILKPGGLLFFQAPFGGGVPEHIPEALQNWISNGGQEYFKKNYLKVASINCLIELKPHCISGVYKKNH